MGVLVLVFLEVLVQFILSIFLQFLDQVVDHLHALNTGFVLVGTLFLLHASVFVLELEHVILVNTVFLGINGLFTLNGELLFSVLLNFVATLFS